jgi:hypothetical protein
MTPRLAHSLACLLPLLVLVSESPDAQEVEGEARCRPDEIDMGDYCAGRPPDAQKLTPGATRRTPFRLHSMMPGHVGEAPAAHLPEPPSGKAVTAPEPGFGVQFGVFSERATAESMVRYAAEAVQGPYHLARIEQGNRILWACIHGPFTDRASAAAARSRLRDGTRFKDAFVKSLDELKLIELEHAHTQE